jgi:hypothetical protein
VTTPATAIKNEIRELIHLHIEMFGQPQSLTSSELIECSCRAERIKQLGQELDSDWQNRDSRKEVRDGGIVSKPDEQGLGYAVVANRLMASA